MAKNNNVQPGQICYVVDYGTGPDGDEGVIHIGIYSSKAKASAAVRELKGKNGFGENKGKFWVWQTKIDSTGWSEGFISGADYLKSVSR